MEAQQEQQQQPTTDDLRRMGSLIVKQQEENDKLQLKVQQLEKELSGLYLDGENKRKKPRHQVSGFGAVSYS